MVSIHSEHFSKCEKERLDVMERNVFVKMKEFHKEKLDRMHDVILVS